MGLTRLSESMVPAASRLGRRMSDIAYFLDPQFGALPNEDSGAAALANAEAMEAFLRFCAANRIKGFIPRSTLYMTPIDILGIDGDLDVECHADFINRDGAAAASRMMLIDGGGTGRIKWRGGVFDANSGPHSCLEVRNWRLADVHVDEGFGIVCDETSSGSTSCLVFANVRRGFASWKLFRDCSRGTNTQGSLPRGFTCSINDGLRSDITVNAGDIYNHHGAFVIGDLAGGVARIKGGDHDLLYDNGIYNVGDASAVYASHMTLSRVEEPIVNSGSGVVYFDSGKILDFGNAIGLQNCPAVEISNSEIRGKVAGSSGFKTRPANVASGALRLFNNRIELTPLSRICDFATYGTLEEFIDIGNRWTVRYSSAISSTTTFFNLTPGPRCRIESDSDYDLLNVGPAIADNTTFFISMPTVTEESYWKSRMRNRTGNSTTRFRTSAGRQQLMMIEGLLAVTNIQSDTEINGGDLTTAPPRRGYSTGAPTAGYFPRGSQLDMINAAAGGKLKQVATTGGVAGSTAVFKPAAAIDA